MNIPLQPLIMSDHHLVHPFEDFTASPSAQLHAEQADNRSLREALRNANETVSAQRSEINTLQDQVVNRERIIGLLLLAAAVVEILTLTIR